MNIGKRNYFQTFFLISFFALFTSCKQIAKFDTVATDTSTHSFSGISSIDSVTDTTATIHWTHVTGASVYQIFSVTAGTLSYIAPVIAPTNSYHLTGLTPNTTTTYRVRLVDSQGQNDNNTTDVTITTIGVPNAPSALTLTSPASSPNFDANPKITIGGVKSGDTVKLFTDSACSVQTGSSAVAAGTTVMITTASLPAATYHFYANATGSGGTSACSNASVSYIKNSCPTGYILVPSNTVVGANNNFCVMKYEAKDNLSNPASTPTGAPWTSINQTNAKAECQSLGANYDLISNPEWMAIARNVENVDSNWTGGAVGSGCLKRGNVGGTNPCTGGDSGYNGSDPESGTSRNALASLTLNNGEVIWDLSGNVWEWVDWTLGGALSTDMTQSQKAYVSADGSPQAAWREFSALDTFPAHSPVTALLPSDSTFNAAQGMGRYNAGTSGGAALRGGYLRDGSSAGAFALALNNSSGLSVPNVGFRCVFRVP